MIELKGIITAMVTPFTEKAEIDQVSTKQLVNRLIDKGVSGLFILGTNGEFHVMTRTEKLAFAELVIKETAGRVPVYVGTGGNSTNEVISLSNEMAKLGADALSVISPYFVGLSEEEVTEHYLKIANEVKVPIILYNIPKNTGINISSKTVSQLAKHPNVIGMKDSSGDLANLESYIKATKDQAFDVLVGSDSLILKALKAGATGAVAATSNVLTTNDIAIYDNWQKGNLAEAQKMQDSIEEFRRVLKFGTLPSVLKAAITNQGINVGDPRLPVLPIKPTELAEVVAVMATYQKEYQDL